MSSFIEQFYEDVDFSLNDPTTSKRINKAKKLRLLQSVDQTIWEKVLTITGQESMAGYDETTITLESEKMRYPLPQHFRQFLRFERRDTDDSRFITGRLNSIPFYAEEAGVVILTAEQGILVKFPPTLTADEEWTLVYLRSPGELHYATAKEAGSNTLTAKPPGTDSGRIVKLPAYYNGAMLNVYEADVGANQVREIQTWSPDAGTFVLRHPWDVIPEGTIKYEIRPTLPPEFQDIYALDVAIRILGPRRRARAELEKDRSKIWGSVLSYYVSNVADRAPTRIIPFREVEVDPYEVQ